jgi:putative component of membrane protein insertase Oxa1/YidC/SpoIIIJ protein YidD
MSFSQTLILAVIILLGSGCARLLPRSKIASGIDAKFKFQKIRRGADQVSSPGIGFYQKVLRQTMASHCDFYPSDSVYAQTLFRKCGGVNAIFKGMSRFMREPDAAALGLPVIKQGNQILFEDLPGGCRWF